MRDYGPPWELLINPLLHALTAWTSPRHTLDHATALLAVMKRSRPRVATCALKTLANRRRTTHHMHEQPRCLCFLGCTRENYSSTHDLDCPFLWALIPRALSTQAPYSVLRRLGAPHITSHSPQSLHLPSHASPCQGWSRGWWFD